MPLSSVGLNATIALPLIINREVIGTLHVSFVKQPDNIVEILNFLIELTPVLTAFLFAVLAEERMTFRDSLRIGAEIFHTLQAILKKDGHVTSVGDEGGFAPNLKNHAQAPKVFFGP